MNILNATAILTILSENVETSTPSVSLGTRIKGALAIIIVLIYLIMGIRYILSPFFDKKNEQKKEDTESRASNKVTTQPKRKRYSNTKK